MKKLGILSLALIALGLAAQTASARPCCSACDDNPTLNICKNGCTPTCVSDDDPLTLDDTAANSEAQVCYADASADDSTSDAPAAASAST